MSLIMGGKRHTYLSIVGWEMEALACPSFLWEETYISIVGREMEALACPLHVTAHPDGISYVNLTHDPP